MAPPIKKWTPNDEAQLQRMLKQKAEFEFEALKPVGEIASDLAAFLHIRKWGATDIAKFLTEHADKLRDALAPFDSGVRSPSSSDSTIR